MAIGPTEWEQENKGVAQDAFNQAAPETKAEPPEANQGQGSEMVESDKPEPALKPEGELRSAVDAEVYNDKLAAEADAANQLTPEEAEALEATDRIQAFEDGSTPEQGQEQPGIEMSDQEMQEALELNEMYNDHSQNQPEPELGR